MNKIRLKHLLSKRGENGSLRDDLKALIPGLAIQDADGTFLLGSEGNNSDKRYAVRHGDQVIGWVTGDNGPDFAARLLNRLIADEAMNAQLTDEVLDLYRELNLLYKLSEKLADSLNPDAVMDITLEEAHRIIPATSGAIILQSEQAESYNNRKSFGSDLDPVITYGRGVGLIGHLIQDEKGEIINEVVLDSRYGPYDGTFSSIIGVPLKAKQECIGILILVSRSPSIYTAADLKLLRALASQAAPTIENALLHERTLREAREREDQLRRRIDELRIELDEARQEEKVAELVETEYFQQLQRQSSDLRKIIEGDT